MNLRRFIPSHLIFLLYVYASGMIAFTLFRLVLLAVEFSQAQELPLSVTMGALLMGARFDAVISGYIVAAPLLLLSIACAFRRQPRWLCVSALVYLSALYCLAFVICAADIPFFDHFFTRITVSALAWTNSSGFMAKMILQDSTYYPYIALLAIVCIAFILVMRMIYRRTLDATSMQDGAARPSVVLRVIGLSLLAMLLTFVGIRGRLAGKSPIRWGTAFFSNYAFANQLGLNPVFTFARSYIDAHSPRGQRLALMNDAEAVRLARSYLGAPDSTGFDSPIARAVSPTGERRNANVIIVLMESLGACRMGGYGNPAKPTPCLDSIAEHSIVFDNLYSAGVHTFNGIYSTLFSFPALGIQHPMNSTDAIQPFTGIGQTLADNGYATAFFTTHDEQFDNMGGFVGYNGYQKVISQKDYPSDRVLSTLGVPDHFMFEYSINELNQLHDSGQPFLAAFMTGSYHGPYILPNDIPFKPRSSQLKQQVLEYADWSIGHFLDLCSRQPWFPNTIFVFVADHGGTDGGGYDMPLDMNHTPAIIYAPGLGVEPHRYANLAGQIDLFPTIMGLLNLPYVNNTMGIDLLRERRPFIYFGADEKVGVLSDEFFLVERGREGASMYHYRDSDRADYLLQRQALADSMKLYAHAMLQATEWMLVNRKVGPQHGKIPERRITVLQPNAVR